MRRHAGVVVPYGWLRKAAAIARGSGAQRSVCASGGEEGVEIGAEGVKKGESRHDCPGSA